MTIKEMYVIELISTVIGYIMLIMSFDTNVVP